MEVWTNFVIAFSTLLPLVNPIGSALVFADMVGPQTSKEYRLLGWRIALASFVFLTACEFAGGSVLRFFGLDLPVVEIAGGAVIAATGWKLLFQVDAEEADDEERKQVDEELADRTLRAQIFYPLTFPVTVGPGCLVAMLTLSARSASFPVRSRVLAEGGVVLAAGVLFALVGCTYSYAPRLLATVSPGTAHGFLRLISFFLLCIGVQIAYRGIAGLHAH